MALERLNEQRVESALAYLAQTDAEYAGWKGMVLRTEYLADVAEALAYKSQTDGSVEDRKRAAKASPEVSKAMESHFEAVVKFETLRARRRREELIIEMYRSVLSARKQGMNV